MRRDVCVGVGLLSLSMLMCEIMTMRQWKIAFNPTISFTAVPCLMMAIGAGAALAHWVAPARRSRAISYFCAAYALLVLIHFLVVAHPAPRGLDAAGLVLKNTLRAQGQGYRRWLSGLEAGVLATVCFMMYGAATALAYQLVAPTVLTAIALLSAAGGAVIATCSMECWGVSQTIGLVFVSGALAALAFAWREPTRWAMLALPPLLWVVPPAQFVVYVYGRAETVWSASNSFSQVQMRRISPLLAPHQLALDHADVPDSVVAWDVCTDEQSSSSILAYNRLSDVGFLRSDITYRAFQAGTPHSALILGAGGGVEVVQALLAGCTSVTAVDINPLMIQASREVAGAPIYRDPRVRVIVSEGRQFLQSSGDRWDLILLGHPRFYGVSGVAHVTAESFWLTREALQLYISHLNPRGVLAIRDRDAFVDCHAQTLQTLQPPHGSLLKISGRPHSLLLFRNEGFAREEVSSSAPLVTELPGERSHPCTDDHPYYSDTVSETHPESASVPYWRQAVRYEGLAILGLLLVVLLLLVPWGFGGAEAPPASLVGYFVLIGIGFVTVELLLMQKMSLFLGHPSLSISVVLSGLLIFGGLGSLGAGAMSPRRLPLLALLLIALLLGSWSGLQWLEVSFLGATWQRIAGSLLLLAPAGLCMGTLFPLGLQVTPTRWIPWMWGVNGAAAALGGLLARVVACWYGFQATLWCGLLAYLLASLTLVWWPLTAPDSKWKPPN